MIEIQIRPGTQRRPDLLGPSVAQIMADFVTSLYGVDSADPQSLIPPIRPLGFTRLGDTVFRANLFNVLTHYR
jgi:hypothetical protein